MTNTTLSYADAAVGTATEADSVILTLSRSHDSMRVKNRNLVLALHKLIANQQISVLTEVMRHDELRSFHPSLLKTILIITKQITGIEPERSRIEQILQQNIPS